MRSTSSSQAPNDTEETENRGVSAAPSPPGTYWSTHNTTVTIVQEVSKCDAPTLQDAYCVTRPENDPDIPLPEEVLQPVMELEPDSDVPVLQETTGWRQQERYSDSPLQGYWSAEEINGKARNESERLLSDIDVPHYTLLGNGRVNTDALEPYSASDTVRAWHAFEAPTNAHIGTPVHLLKNIRFGHCLLTRSVVDIQMEIHMHLYEAIALLYWQALTSSLSCLPVFKTNASRRTDYLRPSFVFRIVQLTPCQPASQKPE